VPDPAARALASRRSSACGGADSRMLSNNLFVDLLEAVQKTACARGLPDADRHHPLRPGEKENNCCANNCSTARPACW
jgi:hypothetical protein